MAVLTQRIENCTSFIYPIELEIPRKIQCRLARSVAQKLELHRFTAERDAELASRLLELLAARDQEDDLFKFSDYQEKEKRSVRWVVTVSQERVSRLIRRQWWGSPQRTMLRLLAIAAQLPIESELEDAAMALTHLREGLSGRHSIDVVTERLMQRCSKVRSRQFLLELESLGKIQLLDSKKAGVPRRYFGDRRVSWGEILH
jgi:hypothetical protein